MNFKKWTTALMLILTVTSCIQDEALNSEAAIDGLHRCGCTIGSHQQRLERNKHICA